MAFLVLGLCTITATSATAQRRVSLAEALAAAESAAPELGTARADSVSASAALRIARAYPNPNLGLDYSKSPPHHHLVLEQPLDYPGVRRARGRAAENELIAAGLLLRAERATLRYRVEVAYVTAVGTEEIARLARQNVATASALVASVRARRDAGDASDLDVALAEVTLGQLRSAALTDSLASVSALLELQNLMGLPADSVEVVPTDSISALEDLALVPASAPIGAATPLRVAAAAQQLAAARARVRLAAGSRFPALSVRAGFDQGDPSDPGILPTFGVTVPLPLFSTGGAELAQARAAEARAIAAEEAAARESALALATAQRQREIAGVRLEVDRTTLAEAQRIAALSLTAYREGAYPLATVLEAQRSARDALRQYLTDLIAARVAEAAFGLASSAGGAIPPP